MTPGWILDVFAAVMLAVAAVSAARLSAARPWLRGSVITDTDVAHLLMAIAMAGMLVSGLATLPVTVWAVIFGVMTAWFAYRVIRDARVNGMRALAGGHCAPHLVHSAAMLYMFLALGPASAGQGMSGMGGSLDVPTLGLVFALILAGYTVWDLDQISARARGRLARAGMGFPAAALAGAPATRITLSFDGGTGTEQERRPAAVHQDEASLRDADTVRPSNALLAPGITVACRIAMGATMTFMLLIMI
jgi:hypothetical protein